MGKAGELSEKSEKRKIVYIDQIKSREELIEPVSIKEPEDIYNLLKHEFAKSKKEYFVVLHLNPANCVEWVEIVSVGIVDSCYAHPREVFKSAIIRGDKSIAIAHNHPSGNCTPSKDDDEITKRLVKAGEIIGIDVLDHIIIADECFYSYHREVRL